MLKFRVKGRMGNQMYIYAFARCLELEYPGQKVFFDDYLDLKNFELTKKDGGLIQFINKIKYRLKTGRHNEKNTLHLDDCRKYYDPTLLRDKQNQLISGYFQSYRYMIPHRDKIIKWFTPTSIHRKTFDNKFGDMIRNEKILTVHIRRTDYVSGGYDYDFLKAKDLSLPVSYYKEALEEAKVEQYDRICFLSDDISFVKKEFSGVRKSFFSEEPAMTDFQLMMHADSCIIANSTFSWWAAWLNKRSDKKIIAPEHFLGFRAGFQFPTDILPPDWTKITVK